MNYGAVKKDCRSPNVVVTTPFKEDDREVHHTALADQIAFLREAGVRLYIPCGSLSEYHSLSKDERIEVVRTTVEHVDGDGSVVAGIGGGIGEVLTLVDRYEDVGADGIMVMYPEHGNDDVAGLIEYYRRIIETTDLAVMFYKSTPELTHEVISPLASYENVVAVKYSVNDIKAFPYEMQAVDEDLVWVTASGEEGFIGYAEEGADGFTTGIGNFAPEMSIALMRAVQTDDIDRARSLRQLAWPYQQLRRETNGVAAVKYGLELAGLYGGPVRPPHVGLSDEAKERAQEVYARMQSELT